MGRHTVPGSGEPTPDRGFWVRLTAVLVAAVLVAAFALTRGDGDGTTGTTASTPGAATSGSKPPPDTSTASSTSPAGSAAPTTSAAPSPAERPPTLSFVVKRPSYITVRVPGGRTLVSRLFTEGQRRNFDQKVLEVVNGRPSAVEFTVNGKPRKPGPADQPETFTVRRR